MNKNISFIIDGLRGHEVGQYGVVNEAKSGIDDYLKAISNGKNTGFGFIDSLSNAQIKTLCGIASEVSKKPCKSKEDLKAFTQEYSKADKSDAFDKYIKNVVLAQDELVNESTVKEDATLDFHETESIKSFLDTTGITSIPDVDSIVEFENEFNDYFGTPFDELSQEEQDLVLSNVEKILGVDDSNDADIEESVVSDTVDAAISAAEKDDIEMDSLDDIPVEEIENDDTIDEDKWITIKGTHVLVDDDNNIKNKKLNDKISGSEKE